MICYIIEISYKKILVYYIIYCIKLKLILKNVVMLYYILYKLKLILKISVIFNFDSMVNDPSTDNLIHWSEDGSTFIGK